jgi:hypothetical protein
VDARDLFAALLASEGKRKAEEPVSGVSRDDFDRLDYTPGTISCSIAE